MSGSICIIDTGVRPHLDLVIPRNRIVYFEDILGHQNLPYDDNGHGTFMAGLCVGNGLLSGGKIIAPAYRHDLVAIKAIDKDGRSSKADILKAINIVLDIRTKYDIRCVLMSFGADRCEMEDSLEDAIYSLYTNNVTTICASGNEGRDHMRSPATSRYAISVGAIDDEMNVVDFTSRGMVDDYYKPDLYSLGVDVIGLGDMGYTKMSGTSVAAPYVAGIVMILKDSLPSIEEKDVLPFLKRLAIKYNDCYIL